MYLEGTKNGSFLIQKWWNLFQRQSTKNTIWCRWGIHSSMGWVSINLHNHSENTAAFRKALGCVGCFWWQAHSAAVLSCSSRHTGEAEQSCVCPAWRRKGGWDLLLSTIYSWLHGMQRGHYLHEEKLSLVIRKKKITMRRCSTEKVAQQGCAICAPGDFQNGAGKSLPLTWKLSAVRRSMGYTTWEALSNLNYSFIQITGYRHHYYCIC